MVIIEIKIWFLSALGFIGGGLVALLGGWDVALTALIILMGVDYLTGILVAGVFKASPKSECGSLESKAGFKGMVRKGCMLLIVLVAVQLDLVLNTDIVRSFSIIAFCANEVISIIENAGLMGIRIPTVITNAIELLNEKSGGSSND